MNAEASISDLATAYQARDKLCVFTGQVFPTPKTNDSADLAGGNC